MNKPWTIQEKVRRLANIQRTITYAFEQIANGTDNWRVNNNLRGVVDDLQRYMEVNPDETVEEPKKMKMTAEDIESIRSARISYGEY